MDSHHEQVLQRFISKWKHEKIKYFDHSCRLLRNGKICGNWLTEDVRYPTKTCLRSEGGICHLCDTKIDYNHPVWPSPYAKLLAIKLGLNKDVWDIPQKRLTHKEALENLSRACGLSVRQFLELDRKTILAKFNSYEYWFGKKVVWCPVFKRQA